MPHNIEIKARLLPPHSIATLLPRALALPGALGPEAIAQDDSFFHAAHGRLKLRRFADGSGELIHYQRGDGVAAKASDYVRCLLPTAAQADALHTALVRGLGLKGRVVKARTLVRVGATRIHLDVVEGLGEFIELEVVLPDTSPAEAAQLQAEGTATAEALMHALGLGTPSAATRIAGAYADLLAAQQA